MNKKNMCKLCTCDVEHGTSRCRRKNTTIFGENIDYMKIVGPFKTTAGGNKQTIVKYEPPSVRAVKKGKKGPRTSKRDKKYHSIYITNLNENITLTDLKDFMEPFGTFTKLFLGKNKITGQCKGYAYVDFKFREDAVKAISALNGYVYDYLILHADWSNRSKYLNQ